eukprot:403333401
MGNEYINTQNSFYQSSSNTNRIVQDTLGTHNKQHSFKIKSTNMQISTSSTPYKDVIQSLQALSPIDNKNRVNNAYNYPQKSYSTNKYSTSDQEQINSSNNTQRNKSSTFFPQINRNNNIGNVMYENDIIQEEKTQNERTLSQTSLTQRNHNSFLNQERQTSILDIDHSSKLSMRTNNHEIQKFTNHQQNDLKRMQYNLVSSMSQIEIDQPMQAITQVSISGQNNSKVKSTTQEGPQVAYQNIQGSNKSAITSLNPSISSTQVNISPEKKSFRIKYNSSVRCNSKNENYQGDVLKNNEQHLILRTNPSNLMVLKASNTIQNNTTQDQINSQHQQLLLKHNSSTQSNKDINLNPSHSIVNTFYVQNGLSQQEKLKLIDALNIQPMSQQQQIKNVKQYAQIQAKLNAQNFITQNGNKDFLSYYLNRNLLEDQPTLNSRKTTQNHKYHTQSPQKQISFTSNHSIQNPADSLIQALKQQALNLSNQNHRDDKNNKEGFQKMKEYIKEKQNELQNEANYIRSKINDQQAAIKSTIMNKNQNSHGMDQNSLIQDFRKINARLSVSPAKNYINSKNQQLRVGNGLNGDLLPLSGIQHQIDHSSSFCVAPNITYESLLTNPGPLQNLNFQAQNSENPRSDIQQQLKFNINHQSNQPLVIQAQIQHTQLGARNRLLQGMIASKKEQQELKYELEAMKQNKKIADEMLKDCLFKNDRLSFEALNQINSIIQSQRALKERIKVANGVVGQHIPLIYDNNQIINNQSSFLHIKGMESPFQLIKGLLEAKAIKEIKDGEISSRTNNSKFEDKGLSNLLTRTIENYKTGIFTNKQSMPLVQNITPRSTSNQNSQFRNSLQNSISPNATLKSRLPNLSPRNIVLSLNPETKIKIYHKPSNNHLEHPINAAISKINYIIKLIFKSHKDLSLQIPLLNQQNQIGQNNQSTFLQNLSNQPQHIIEEAKLNEIQRMAKQFQIQIPKRFDNKTAHREYFQSKEFITNIKIRMNQMLHTAINDSNGMTQLLQQQLSAQQTSGSNIQYSQKFYVGRGNNDSAVKSVLKQRSWWIQNTEEDFNESNLVWTQWKKQKHLDFLKNNGNNLANKSIKIYGKMEQNKQLTNKKGVFINMREYYMQMEQDPFEVLPLTFLVKSGLNDPEFQRFLTYYNNLTSQAKIIEQQRQEALALRYKQIQDIKEQKLLEKQQKNPNTIVLPSLRRKKPAYSDYSEDEEYEASDYSDENQDEPGENTNRGNGINVSSNLNEIKNLVQKANSNAKKEKTYIIQKYIDNPLLINSRKFDFRCYGVMTSMNGFLKGYFYEDAYIRTSCKEYDIENLNNKYIHLTNDAVQKHSQDYGKFENGNKMSLQDFQKYLKQQYPSYHIDIKRDLMPQIRKLITDSYRSVYAKIDPSRLHNTFELFGYDFMLDEDFRLYLIEVNTNPCLEMSSPLLCRIIPEVLDNAFRIILDPIFPSPDLSSNKKCAINEIPQEIKFTLVFDETIEGPELKKLQNKFGGIKEEIESDEEDELNQDENNVPGDDSGEPKAASSQFKQ